MLITRCQYLRIRRYQVSVMVARKISAKIDIYESNLYVDLEVNELKIRSLLR